jgi:hypothetical protein
MRSTVKPHTEDDREPGPRALTDQRAAGRHAEQSALTIQHAWRGLDHDGDGLNWWAVAFGRADGHEPLRVTFTGRKPGGRQRNRNNVPVRTIVTPTVTHGLWVAAVPGLHFAVTCRQGGRQCVRQIAPPPGQWPPARFAEHQEAVE